MKAKIQVQFNNNNVNVEDIEKSVKEALKAQGTKVSTVETLEIYYKPEINGVYYVATTKTGEAISNQEPLYI